MIEIRVHYCAAYLGGNYMFKVNLTIETLEQGVKYVPS